MNMSSEKDKRSLPAVDMRKLKSGGELIVGADIPEQMTLLDFWKWSGSDVLSNAPRGVFAEFTVGLALRAVDSPREEWASYDLETPDGIRVEVKSAAYVQSWDQDKLSEIRFDIRPTLDEESTERGRHSDVYVFALLAEKDKAKINPLDVDQWEFYVVSARQLDRECGDQATIGINPLRELAGEEVPYDDLESKVKSVASRRVANEG